MDDDIPCVVIECSCSHEWELRHTLSRLDGPREIPTNRRPVILHPNRATAEAEAKRLAAAHPQGVFVVFEAVAAGLQVKVPTHVNHRGQVLISGSTPALVQISQDDGIPF